MRSLGEFVGHIMAGVKSDPTRSRQEVSRTVEEEQRGDLILRRTDLAVTGRLTIADLERMADLAAFTLNWDARRRRAELRSTRAVLENWHGMVLR